MSFRNAKRLTASFCSYYKPNPDLSSTGSTFYANKLISKLKKGQNKTPYVPGKTAFGKAHTDHIISIDWDRNTGWSNPILGPFQDVSIHAFSSALHYGVQCYQGTKAYKNDKGQVRLFRVEQNALRFKNSSKRITLPDFDGRQLVNLISQYVKLEEDYIPPHSQSSLYVRPLHLGISETLGVHSPQKSKILIMASPVGSYYASGFKPISLYCATDSIRSAPMGTGSYKIGGNYGPTIQEAVKAESKGYQQVLWLHQNKIGEVGSSNIFFVFSDGNGKIEIATPQIEDLVLPGITRDSVLTLLRDQNQYKISQRKIYIQQVIERHKKGEVLQCFGSGTAVILGSVDKISYADKQYLIPVDKKLNIGPIAHKIRTDLLNIQQGRAQDKFGWITRVK